MKYLTIAVLALALQGCATLGVSFDTEFGKFTYQLPEPKGTKK